MVNAWAATLLAIALLPVLLQFRPGRPVPTRRGAIRSGNRFRQMATGALWRFGVPVPLLLALAGRLPALVTMPPEFVPLADASGLSAGSGRVDPWLVGGLIGGALIGLAVAAAASAWQAWRDRPARYWFGDFAALEATDRADRGWAVVLSLVAGVTEEGYFRLLLPLLAAMAFPRDGLGAIAGFVGSTLLFGAAHRYQGWRGVVMTTVVGAGMAVLYLASGSLVLAMAYHALVDVGSLVVRPWVREAVGRRVRRRA